ncbi:MAG TPA: SIS domain-containing protein [Synergistales bacterium]|mgnify:CR=1 FL=1|nr:SIS domain-containing protein [Synergistales bacterium]
MGIPPDNPPAEYFSNRLNLFRSRVHLVTSLNVDTFPALNDVQKDSVAVVFSFPRYPARGRDTALFLKEKGATLIGITDSRLSPLASLTDILLLSPLKFITIIEPYGGVMALLHSLLVGLLFCDRKKGLQRTMEYDSFVRSADYYIHKDIDIIDFA